MVCCERRGERGKGVRGFTLYITSKTPPRVVVVPQFRRKTAIFQHTPRHASYESPKPRHLFICGKSLYGLRHFMSCLDTPQNVAAAATSPASSGDELPLDLEYESEPDPEWSDDSDDEEQAEPLPGDSHAFSPSSLTGSSLSSSSSAPALTGSRALEPPTSGDLEEMVSTIHMQVLAGTQLLSSGSSPITTSAIECSGRRFTLKSPPFNTVQPLQALPQSTLASLLASSASS